MKAQLNIEGQKYLTSSMVIPMIEELCESLRSTCMHYTTIDASRGVKILEDIIRRRCAAYFQRTVPWFRTPSCVLGDRYSEYEIRTSPPSRRRLLPAYRPLVPSTIMRAWRQVQRVRDEKFPAVAAPPTSGVPPPGPEHHYVCSKTGTASTR